MVTPYTPGLADLVSGTAAVINGSTVVTFTSATPLQWTNSATGSQQQAANRGDAFICAQGVYEVASIDSATQLTLEQPYAGVTSGQASYKLRRRSIPDSTNATSLLDQLLKMGTDGNPDPARTIDDSTARLKLRMQAFKACISVGATGTADAALKDCLVADPATGAASFPNGLFLPAPGFRNRLINGQFCVWQRGISFSVANNTSVYTADRWMVSNITGSAMTVTRIAAPPGFRCPDAINLTTSVASSTGYCDMLQRIEGRMLADIAGQPLTLSFDILSSSTGGPLSGSVLLLANTAPDNGTYSVWQANIPFVIPNGPGRVTVALNAAQNSMISQGAVLYIRISQTGAAGIVNLSFGAVQLEPGPVANAAEFRPQQIETLLCQRYYTTGLTNILRTAPGGSFGGGLSVLSVPPMRATPSVTTSGYSGSYPVAPSCGSFGLSNIGFWFSAGTAVGDYTQFTYAASAEL